MKTATVFLKRLPTRQWRSRKSPKHPDEENRIIGSSEYFIGSVVACGDETGTYQLIDGQQRLTTIYVTICAIRDQLVQLGEAATQSLQTIIKSVSMDRRTMEDVSR